MRVRLTFSPLASPEYSRRLLVAKVDEPTLRSTVLKSFRDDVAVVTLEETHGVRFTVQTLDALGRLILGSDTSFSFFPSTQEPASTAQSVSLGEPEASQGEGPWVETKPTPIGEAEDTGTTGNADVPVVSAADETPQNTPEPTPQTVASAGNMQHEVPPQRTLVEVRVSDDTVSDPSDAQYVTTVPIIGEDRPVIKTPLCSTTGVQRVWMRRFIPDGHRVSEWVSRDLPVHVIDPTFMMVEDFSNNWSGGTIENVYGYPSMYDNAGVLTMNEVPSVFALDAADGAPVEGFPDSIFSMDEGPGMFSMEDLFPYGRFVGPSVDHGAVHDFYPRVCVEVDSMNRITERSIFAEEYNMFSTFRGPSGGVPPGLRPAEGAGDISMFGSQSDGDPVRVLAEVNLDSGGYKIVKPGDRCVARVVQPRLTVFSTRGLRAPTLDYWRWSRWLRNRKWEFDIPWDPATPTSPTEFIIPGNVWAVEDLVFNATVVTPHEDGVEYNVSIDESSIAAAAAGSPINGTLKIYVEQVVRVTEEATAGAWSTTWAKAFAAVPTVVALANDPTDFSYAGYSAVSATASNGYFMFPPGSAAIGAQPGDGNVDIIARGVPLEDALGGDVRIHLQIMGA